MKSFFVLIFVVFALSSCFEKPEEGSSSVNSSTNVTVQDTAISDEVILDIIANEETEGGSIEPIDASQEEIPAEEKQGEELPEVKSQGEADVTLKAEEKALIDENIEILDEILTDILDS